ncbi:glycoside hydrolase family 32 protein [Luteolibacter soli]|uniref:Glycoside hydrolase family 32 protein n=1 Tax=Luteolibacter soli TaxID=3135280 RepID=A0ABU9AVC7_9BACT
MNTLLKTTALFAAFSSTGFAAPEIVLADFEKSTYEPWTVTGEAFGPGPAQGALPGQMGVDGFRGKGLVNTFFNGDDTIGTLTSPEFRIDRKFIGFLIGGGKNEQGLALQLLVDGKVVRSATGNNDRPGGSEELQQESWDVSDLAGKKAVLKIVDDAKGGWGHLTVDQIVQTDTKPKGVVSGVERSFTATTRYLNIPIKNGAPHRVVTLLVDGKVIVRNDIELADGPADWWAPMDVSAWKGKKLTLRVDKLHEDSKALAAVDPGNEIKNADNLYEEPLRGQFHFSPMRGWNNDPNGMVFYNGEYHLFFQHNPYGWAWGNMTWGHAVSKDMVHWEELPSALLPDEMGPMFSGGAVVDWKNTSGFGKDGKPPMVVFYTAAGNPTVQCMAYSNDGRHFTKYEGNPIIKEISGGNRDPKVVWHEPTKSWVLVFYVELGGVHTMHFFTSPNLKEWTFASKIDGFFECPEFFEAPVDGDATKKKWVLSGASSDYRIGSFDGKTFTPETSMLPGQRGKDFYAAQAFSDQPDGRHILIGWWRTETRGMPFNQSMSIPLDLRLVQTAEGPRLTYTPVKELEALRAKSHRIAPQSLKPGDKNPLDDIRAELVEVRAEFEPGEADEVIFNIRDVMVVYDAKKQEFSVNGHRAPAPLIDGKQRITIFCDRTGVEAFASDGLCFIPMPINLKGENRRLYLETRGGAAKIASLEVHELRSAWKTK